MKIKIVGIDYLSIDNYHNEDLPIHKLLLLNDVLIVENIDLRHITNGRYKTIIAPLKLDKLDGAPVRVFSKKLD